MRLKKVKNAVERVQNSSYSVNFETLGINEKIFDNNNPIHLEIGIGKGNFIITLAKNNPDINYLGVEMFDSVIIRAIEKAEEHGLNNLKFIRLDAKLLQDKFYNYFDKLYLNFSDPWPKKRHEKRRLTSKEFLKTYETILKPLAPLAFKTDNTSLFEYSVQSMNNYGCIIDEFSIDLHNSVYNEGNVQTEYEQKFSRRGEKIKYIQIFYK